MANNSYAGQLIDEIKLLKEQIEKMKCCANCRYSYQGDYDCFENCGNCEAMYSKCDNENHSCKERYDYDEHCEYWEMKE